jgi:hypothetical protein
MAEITVAIDEQGADQFFDAAIGLIPAQSSSGNGSLGPFLASYSASASFAPGDIDLIAPGTIRITDFQVNWNLNLSFGLDLSAILPDFCIPQVCVDIPCVGEVCTPEICVDWPTITVPVSFGDFVKATADFGISITLSGGVWRVEAVVQGVPNLQFGLVTAALLAAISAALTLVLLAVPFIGPFLAIAVNAIIAAIGIAGVTGLLGLIITPFVSGLRIPFYEQPQTFEALPAGGPVDPAVFITLDGVSAFITSDTEDELVLEVDIS